MTGPVYEMPESIELSWAEYRVVIRALDDTEAELSRSGPAYEALLRRVRHALRVLIHRVWPELGEAGDDGTVEP